MKNYFIIKEFRVNDLGKEEAPPAEVPLDCLMKLLHTADLHLDSPFCASGVLGAQARRAAQRSVLKRIFACAEAEGCDLILIAGDLFDAKYVTPETASFVLSLLGTATCPVVIAPGNHDPYGSGSFYQSAELPEQVYVFNSTELQCVELESLRLRVFGYGFTSPVLRESPLNGQTPPEKGDWFHVLCGHADLFDPLSRYCPLTVGDIERFGFDYAALGHVHNRPDKELSDRTCIRYSGFAQGRSFDELGDGGVLLVSLEAGQPLLVEWRQISEERYLTDELDVSGCDEERGVADAIREAIAPYEGQKGTHLRLTLTGSADADETVELAALSGELGAGLGSLELRDETVPTADGARLQKDVTLRGAFYRALYPQLIDEDPAVRRRAILALQIGLAAIEDRRIPGRRTEP